MNQEIYDNYILQVVKHGSITAAARALGISQPALSLGISTLEKELGFKLLFRRTVPAALTPEGEIYYAYINRRKVLNADLKRRLESYRNHADSCFSIAAPSVYTDSLLPEAIAAMKAKRPDCGISIKSGDLDEMIRMCSEGEVNCFISTSDRLPENFVCQRLFEEHICLCVHRKNKHYAAIAAKPEVSSFDSSDFIFLEQGQPLRTLADSLFEKAGTAPEHSIIVNQVSTALRLVGSGLGVCLAAEETTAGYPEIAAFRMDVPARSIFLAYDRDLFLPAYCTEFIELLKGI